MKSAMVRAATVLALALATALAWPRPALGADGNWATSSVRVEYRNVPLPPAIPTWARPPVTVDGPVVWVVARLAPSVTAWADRLLEGSGQAQQRLFATAEEAVAQRSEALSPAQRAQVLEGVRERLKLWVDRESYVEVETAERPDAVWMRFGYPTALVTKALGYPIAGAATPSAAPPAVARPRPLQAPSRPLSDYVWESAWFATVVVVTVIVSGVAIALGR